MQKTGFRWEDVTVDNITVDDLDDESFKIFRREALSKKRMTEIELNIPNVELLQKLHLMTDGKLKKSAVLLFYRDPSVIQNGSFVKVGKFDERGCVVYHNDLEESLIVNASKVIDLIYQMYLKAKIGYEHDVRVEEYPFAREAIREAVYNAIAHNCYMYGTPIQIRVGLVCDDHLTNAGEILFGNTRPVSLKAGIFATDEKLTFLDMKLFEDNIYNLLNIAEEYILKNIRWRSEITGTEREEIPEIPVAVIREVLANSFAHAIYNGRTTHEICIHPGMITVYSPGEYASKHKPEEYIKDNIESEIRNATIAKILYLSKSIEQFGSGFKRINSLCNDAGINYSYENRENGFKFVIYRPELQSDIPSVTLDVTLNGTEMVVLAILKQKPDSSRDEIADKISKTVRTVQRALDSLRDKGYIRRVGSKQNPVWEILK